MESRLYDDLKIVQTINYPYYEVVEFNKSPREIGESLVWLPAEIIDRYR